MFCAQLQIIHFSSPRGEESWAQVSSGGSSVSCPRDTLDGAASHRQSSAAACGNSLFWATLTQQFSLLLLCSSSPSNRTQLPATQNSWAFSEGGNPFACKCKTESALCVFCLYCYFFSFLIPLQMTGVESFALEKVNSRIDFFSPHAYLSSENHFYTLICVNSKSPQTCSINHIEGHYIISIRKV